jgi:REP element-mobilizing transposase RayT
MPDHVHLLINPMDEEYNISNILILKDIKTDTARKAVKYLKENKPTALSKLSTAQQYRKYRFWQKGCRYDRNIIKQNIFIIIP